MIFFLENRLKWQILQCNISDNLKFVPLIQNLRVGKFYVIKIIIIVDLDLKRGLYCIFSNYGPLLDIVALKTQTMRGQAFVVFADIIGASHAYRELQGLEFFDKSMVIQYAKTKSDVVAKSDGTFIPRKRKKKEGDEEEGSGEEKPEKKTRSKKRKAEDGEKRQPRSRSAPPNKTLFIQNLPDDCTEEILISVFQPFTGFTEVRMAPGRKGLAFVEFQNEAQSTIAMAELQGYRLTHDHAMQISFQKKIGPGERHQAK